MGDGAASGRPGVVTEVIVTGDNEASVAHHPVDLAAQQAANKGKFVPLVTVEPGVVEVSDVSDAAA